MIIEILNGRDQRIEVKTVEMIVDWFEHMRDVSVEWGIQVKPEAVNGTRVLYNYGTWCDARWKRERERLLVLSGRWRKVASSSDGVTHREFLLILTLQLIIIYILYILSNYVTIKASFFIIIIKTNNLIISNINIIMILNYLIIDFKDFNLKFK